MLAIENITKQYAGHKALSDVSFNIEKGKIFGLLGPNGAGKTSLIRIINQITFPDSGRILFNGEVLQAKHISKIGYLPEERGLYKKMQIGEQILYLGQLKGLTRHESEQKIKAWFKKLGIESWWTKKVEELSKGMQQKVQFIATVLHQPDLIILDEPFSGFDPVNAEVIKNEILELNAKGSTIIFSTHRMESVEELCDDIALIHKSQKLLDGSVESVKDQFKLNQFKVVIKAENELSAHAAYEIIEQKKSDGFVELSIRNQAGSMNELLSILMKSGEVHAFSEMKPSINDIFIKVVS
jgi:ABC-2 type transport system ATP-binding protein